MATKKIDNRRFLQATANLTGAVGVFHVYANEADLKSSIDVALRNKSGNALYYSEINENGIRYGWLFSSAREALDEVLVAKPKAGVRVIMCHGGQFICQGISALLLEKGFIEIRPENGQEHQDDPKEVDGVVDWLLTSCQTETQVEAVLAAREMMKITGELKLPFMLFTTQHLCLAGPPNAGKSSLLNRLTGFDRAFVHAEAGATRDAVGERVEVAGYSVLLEDLPGFVSEKNTLMDEALALAELRLKLADVVAFVCDASTGWDKATEQAARWVHDILIKKNSAAGEENRVMLILNKSDLGNAISGKPWRQYLGDPIIVETSSLPGGAAAEDFASGFFLLMEEREKQFD